MESVMKSQDYNSHSSISLKRKFKASFPLVREEGAKQLKKIATDVMSRILIHVEKNLLTP
ncbi:hypothetical protein H5410_063431 [Solanum commersonii]|uniref:Uncharacterized protein n=1 Tax=Solanum commersonii TaxID=4109 RepID=A0A9J5WD88_SOLCO|nr:hypothetical protein H5410_063431 [Solanum commersonii]